MNYELIERVLLHLTNVCNLSCKHCYVASYQGKYFTSNDLKRINYILKTLDKPIDITGGEPFLFKDFEGYLRLCFEEELKISSIFTNGTFLLEREDLLFFLYKKIIT